MKRRTFEQHVAQAIAALPPQFRTRLDNVEVVVADWPDAETLHAADVSDPLALHGFYHGTPLTHRSSYYGLTPPDKISIFRGPIHAACTNDAEIEALITTVVRHEFAHYFGISDERLRELGAY